MSLGAEIGQFSVTAVHVGGQGGEHGGGGQEQEQQVVRKASFCAKSYSHLRSEDQKGWCFWTHRCAQPA